ncbi:MAG: acetyl-CoA carboxylase carboxyl transferase subunit alpha, partial [Candidatus Aminicenantes bacterium]|nr:acetyl-CoA carboxylase carboxyl transferase subunit alpha [Candidatus Aminicenantes bacterium]
MKEQKDYYQLEKNILHLKQEIDDISASGLPDQKEKIAQLREQIAVEWEALKPNLTAQNIVQIARHPQRPYTLDYLEYLTDDFLEFHGDRRAGDDPA